ncbi:PilZ domain-containing protein [Candidatus Sumerlaeota bacterium]|nr:PilZ domain-containing protein [Candidatus Sumerlaeota bacterium]
MDFDDKKDFSPEQKDRSGTRFPQRISIAYSQDVEQKPDKKFTSYKFGTLVDISQRGLCFIAQDEFQTPGILHIFLKLSHSSRGLKILGKIIWLKSEPDGKTRLGIQFIGMLPPEWRDIVQSSQQLAAQTPVPDV